jgi:hypothetical protein
MTPDRRATADILVDGIGDEDHPLADVLDYPADQGKAHRDERFSTPETDNTGRVRRCNLSCSDARTGAKHPPVTVIGSQKR